MLTKAEVIEHFDELVTDRTITRAGSSKPHSRAFEPTLTELTEKRRPRFSARCIERNRCFVGASRVLPHIDQGRDIDKVARSAKKRTQP